MNIGDWITYTLTGQDADQINRRRTTGEEIKNAGIYNRWNAGTMAHIGNEAKAGDKCPALVVSDAPGLQVFLDGTDVLWVPKYEAPKPAAKKKRGRPPKPKPE